jgi:enoyl-CoA hydratase/carnithine racemase
MAEAKSMNYTTLELHKDQATGVATIMINRPEKYNSFSKAMTVEFRHVWGALRDDHDVRAIVLRAADCPAFCTGVDVNEGWPQGTQHPFDEDDPGDWLGPKQHRLWKPVICAVHGLCCGGAFYWLNEADIIICSSDAQFFDPHVTFGLVAAVEPVGLLGRIPYGDIMRMTLMGNDERISAQTALRIGLVTEVLDDREMLWARAQELAKLVAAKPAAAVQGSVRALWESQDLPKTQAVRHALSYTQVGNPVSLREVERASVPKAKYRTR